MAYRLEFYEDENGDQLGAKARSDSRNEIAVTRKRLTDFQRRSAS